MKTEHFILMRNPVIQ